MSVITIGRILQQTKDVSECDFYTLPYIAQCAECVPDRDLSLELQESLLLVGSEWIT
jgi:hypothetical protein